MDLRTSLCRERLHSSRGNLATMYKLSFVRVGLLQLDSVRSLAGKSRIRERRVPNYALKCHTLPIMRAQNRSAVQVFTNLFPVWSLTGAAVGIFFPVPFLAIRDVYLTLGLGALMLSMGLTLSLADLMKVSTKWRELLLCFVGCYAVMPLAALLLTKIFALDRAMAVGLILLGIVSGGQASNLCTYIAGGDTALSVAMTTMTTFSSIVMLPLLSQLLIGEIIPIDVMAVAKSALQVVLLPIFLGAGLNTIAPALSKAIEPSLPIVGILATCFLVTVSIAKTSAALQASLIALIPSVVLLHLVGGIFGYLSPLSIGLGEMSARTLSIETAFKSPVLSFVLATKHFQDLAVRLPSAVSIVVLAPLIALLAVYLRSKPIQPQVPPASTQQD